jgi:hypothetical protein
LSRSICISSVDNFPFIFAIVLPPFDESTRYAS